MTIELTLTEGLAPQEEETILDRLRSYNTARFGHSERRDLAIPLYEADGTLAGGLVGYTGRGWLHVSMLYVPEPLRGRGLATRMLAMAEQEARRRGCDGAYLDTMNPAALRLYERQGYARIGRLDGLRGAGYGADGAPAVTWLAKRF